MRSASPRTAVAPPAGIGPMKKRFLFGFRRWSTTASSGKVVIAVVGCFSVHVQKPIQVLPSAPDFTRQKQLHLLR